VTADRHDDGEKVKGLSATEIKARLDGKDAKVKIVEVTIEPGQSGVQHHYAGPGFGYVLEGEYELAIVFQPSKVLKAGDTFFEPAGSLHRVSKNPGQVKTRLIAMVLHTRNAK